MRYYCIAPNGRKSYIPKWLYEKRERSRQYEVGVEESAPTDSAHSSTDYTIAELREMKADIDDWESFTEGDSRKSIDQL